MNFKNWIQAKEKAEELNLYTNAYLKEKYNRKPIKDAPFEIHKVYTNSSWKPFKFYKFEDTEIIKNRTATPLNLNLLEETTENISKSLYIINKSAKKSRDTKKAAYSSREFKVVNGAKTRQTKLYELKDKAISKAIELEYLKLQGYHLQGENKLLMYKCTKTGLTFHVPVDEINEANIKLLGEIGIISAESTLKCDITFTQAKELLERFII